MIKCKEHWDALLMNRRKREDRERNTEEAELRQTIRTNYLVLLVSVSMSLWKFHTTVPIDLEHDVHKGFTPTKTKRKVFAFIYNLFHYFSGLLNIICNTDSTSIVREIALASIRKLKKLSNL